MDRPPEHPGIELERRIIDMKMTYAEFARTADISPSTISELISCKRSLSIDSAIKIANFFDTDIQYWLSKQMRYDIYSKSISKT